MVNISGEDSEEPPEDELVPGGELVTDVGWGERWAEFQEDACNWGKISFSALLLWASGGLFSVSDGACNKSLSAHERLDIWEAFGDCVEHVRLPGSPCWLIIGDGGKEGRELVEHS